LVIPFFVFYLFNAGGCQGRFAALAAKPLAASNADNPLWQGQIPSA
jgi:hypothetical protein